ncbi:hypothetical protein DRO41_05870 [Candidatus Bathyarchaeota archaeon]|nr:MAG: hypothetical protein DRO41_05870 [Candidatus Bathyarchaeota archaeon]
MKFIIETKDDRVLIEAQDKDHAFAKYFKDISEHKIPLEKIGNVIILSDGKDEYPMRTVPLLWKMGVLETKLAIDNLVRVLGVSHFEAERLLKKYGDIDARLIPLMDEV